MSYSGTMVAQDWLYMIQTKAQNLVGIINEGQAFYQKWYAFTYGKSMSAVGVLLGISTDEATDMNAAFQVLKELNDAVSNTAVATDDRKTKLLKFV